MTLKLTSKLLMVAFQIHPISCNPTRRRYIPRSKIRNEKIVATNEKKARKSLSLNFLTVTTKPNKQPIKPTIITAMGPTRATLITLA